MSRGIYIIANDKVTEQAIALLNSIRLYDRDVPVVMIPYDETYQQVADILGDKFGVTVYEDLDFIKRLSQTLQEIFGGEFFARPNQFRKQACWFGPFDEFLYIDTDIVVFEKIIDNLNYLQEQDFICCDYQHRGGITNVFTPKVIEDEVFTPEELRSIFNGGFWAAKKGVISEQDLYDSFAECAAHPEYFDFSQKTSDQPIINYMILKRVKRRFNIVQRPEKAAGSWAGTNKFQPMEGYKLFDPDNNQPLQYLHWAGIRIQPGCSYWEIWEHYRYLNEAKPTFYQTKSEKKTFLNAVRDRFRKLKANL
ncbi:methionine synthase [Laspinema sp. D1]|uniref:Npun_R2821/Npun_R2822 family protein n=1 Tax=Laspinema palackyanum TaxID=3231601 RepID=UPI00347F0636|nr:methionine synthase [Laspinema sp. D2b]